MKDNQGYEKYNYKFVFILLFYIKITLKCTESKCPHLDNLIGERRAFNEKNCY